MDLNKKVGRNSEVSDNLVSYETSAVRKLWQLWSPGFHFGTAICPQMVEWQFDAQMFVSDRVPGWARPIVLWNA